VLGLFLDKTAKVERYSLYLQRVIVLGLFLDKTTKVEHYCLSSASHCATFAFFSQGRSSEFIWDKSLAGRTTKNGRYLFNSSGFMVLACIIKDVFRDVREKDHSVAKYRLLETSRLQTGPPVKLLLLFFKSWFESDGPPLNLWLLN
jgi:hypothetical protein